MAMIPVTATASIDSIISTLNYRSESDSLWFPCHTVPREGQILDFDTFFTHTIATQPQSKAYVQLKDAILRELHDVVIRKTPAIGHYNLILTIQGRQKDGNWKSIFTFATET